MSLGPERSAASRDFLICFLCVCQLTWILPFIFFLGQPSPSPKLVNPHDQNASRLINSKGFAGPLGILGQKDLFSLKAIGAEWNALWPNLRDEYVLKGLNRPLERTCFIWLAECYNLAKHGTMTQIAREVIGPNVVLYGMMVWDGNNEVMQHFHRDNELADCSQTMTFVSGTSVQLISQSHKISNRSLLQVILRLLAIIERESLKHSTEEEQVAKFDKLFVTKIRKLVRNADLRFEKFEPAAGYGVLIKGGTGFRLGRVLEGRKGLLMQYASANCKVRQSAENSWGIRGTSYSLHVPPVLLVAGAITESNQFNDLRLSLAKEEVMDVKTGLSNVLGNSVLSKKKTSAYAGSAGMQAAVLFSKANTSVSWQERGIWRFQTIGETSTNVMSLGKIEQFHVSKRQSHLGFHGVTNAGQHVIVALCEGVLYSRWVNVGDYCYYEVLELRPGSAVLLSPQFLHALKPLGPNTTFMSFRWVGYDNDDLFEESKHNVHFKLMDRQDRLDKEFLGHGNTKATQGRTINLNSGQAYDPDNNENCDVLVFVIEGNLLQVLPSNTTLRPLDVLLIPADHSCVLWNVDSKPVKLFAMHICHFNNDIQIITSFGASGKIF